MLVYVVVPVAPFEPESVITKSIECLRELECDNLTLEVYYVIDTSPNDKRNLHWKLPANFKVVVRSPRGRKAGAMNDILSVVKDADYVTIFDVDQRPAKDYIIKCVAALEENDSVVFSSGCFFINNNKENIITKMLSIEYIFTASTVSSLSRSDINMTLGGAGGVVKGSFLKGEKFDEEASGEDLDMLTRMYLKGKVTVPAKTTVGEQAPVTLKDLYNQRVRWYKGNVECLSKHFMPMCKAPIPFSRKISWFFIMTLPFFAFLLTPGVILLLDKIKKQSNSSKELLKIFLGGIGFVWLMTVCGIVANIKHITSRQSEWKPSKRSNV
jgi:cellulose synthase/poly-beta-1,6-N-acetylglucosamine synthase-like glycosyltransferase